MPTHTELDPRVAALASPLAALVVALLGLHWLVRWLPFLAPVERGLLKLVGVLALVGGTVALASAAPGTAVALWCVVGLPLYLFRRAQAGAPAREAWAKRLEAARGHERRSAQLPPSAASPPATPPRATTPSTNVRAQQP